MTPKVREPTSFGSAGQSRTNSAGVGMSILCALGVSTKSSSRETINHFAIGSIHFKTAHWHKLTETKAQVIYLPEQTLGG